MDIDQRDTRRLHQFRGSNHSPCYHSVLTALTTDITISQMHMIHFALRSEHLGLEAIYDLDNDFLS